MKTIKITFLVIVAAALLHGQLQAQVAYDFKVGQFYYKITNATTRTVRLEAELLNYSSVTKSRYTSEENKPSGDLVIPEIIYDTKGNYTVTAIGPEAFRGCTGVTSIDIPASVTIIGSGFDIVGNCPLMTAFTVNSGNTKFTAENGVLFSKDKSTLIRYPEGKKGDTYTIPAVVNTLAYKSFNNSQIKSITIPSTVTSIKMGAFNDCNSLSTVKIPETIKEIEPSTFSGSGITHLDIPQSVTRIGDYALSYCTELVSVNIPEGITTIEAYTFISSNKLPSIKIPSSVTSIDNNAFRSCKGLTSITLENPDPATLGIDVFTGISADVVLYVPQGRKTVYENTNVWKTFTDIRELGYLFKANNLHYGITNSFTKEIRLLPELMSGTYPAYTAGYEPAGKISIPQNVTYNKAIYNVTNIANNAFRGCGKLNLIDIPASVTNIGDNVFTNCTGLSVLVSRNSTPPALGATAFANVPKNIPVQVPKDSKTAYAAAAQWKDFTNLQEPEYDLHDDTFFFKIISKTLSRSASVIPELAFGSAPFYTPAKLLKGKIVIPDNIVYSGRNHPVTVIDENAFARNVELTQVVLPNTVKNIRKSAFEYCSILTDITVNEGLDSIGERAFFECFKLKVIELPASVSYIGQFAFSGCQALQSVTSKSITPPKADYFSFMNVPKNIPLYVPVGSKKAYENADQWKEFTNIIERVFESATPLVSQNIFKTWSDNGVLHIKTNATHERSVVEIFNIGGQILYKSMLNSQIEIPLPSGVYVVRSENYVQKVVVK